MLAHFNFFSGVTILVATLREDLRVLCSQVERNLINVYRSEKCMSQTLHRKTIHEFYI
jgi:hypothetical protein